MLDIWIKYIKIYINFIRNCKTYVCQKSIHVDFIKQIFIQFKCFWLVTMHFDNTHTQNYLLLLTNQDLHFIIWCEEGWLSFEFPLKLIMTFSLFSEKYGDFTNIFESWKRKFKLYLSILRKNNEHWNILVKVLHKLKE